MTLNDNSQRGEQNKSTQKGGQNPKGTTLWISKTKKLAKNQNRLRVILRRDDFGQVWTKISLDTLKRRVENSNVSFGWLLNIDFQL